MRPLAWSGMWALLLAVPGKCETLWILGEGQPAGATAVAPEALAAVLARDGREVEIVSAETAVSGLSAPVADALVVSGPGYPVSLREPLLAYLRAGGGLVALSGDAPALSLPAYRDGDAWKPVNEDTALTVEKDKLNVAKFEPVTTTGLRIEVELQPEFSGGILEWRVVGGE